MEYKCELNEYGFYQRTPLPTDEELREFYESKYYQDSLSITYEKKYSDIDLDFINLSLMQKEYAIHRSGIYKGGILDIGCGEGYVLKYFFQKGWEVLGIDFSEYGIKTHNQDMMDFFIQGNIFEVIEDLIFDKKEFDIINIDCVLEHVLNPEKLIILCKKILKKNGRIIVKVPNDFNVLQNYMYENNIIDRKKWICYDHISYFNPDGLKNIFYKNGFKCDVILGDQIIEVFALNTNTNYYCNSDVGKSCHYARVHFEKILTTISLEKRFELCKALGALGLGRELIGIFYIR